MFIKRTSKIGILVFFVLAVCGSSLWAQGSVYFFPQVADGISGSTSFASQFFLNNTLLAPNTITMTFTRSNGTPFAVDFRSVDRPDAAGTLASTTFTLQAGETAHFFTGAVSPLTVGWCKLTSTAPLEVSEVFDVLKLSGTPIIVTAEAGVLPSTGATLFSFDADVATDFPETGTNTNTGIAIANFSGADTDITATLLNRTGTQINQKLFSVSSNHQTALFLNQIFPDTTFTGLFHGTVRFSSNVNVAIVALRDISGPSGDTFSTVAVNPDSTLGYNIFYDREENDSIGSAQPISLPARIIGTMIAPNGGPDADVFSVSLQAGQTLYVLSVADLIGSPLDDVIEVKNSSNVTLAENDDFSTGLRDPFVRFVVPTTGTYFIEHGSTNGTSTRGSYYELLVRVK
ncbi:MAG: PPC domain-containing protein [Terriglobia bacterium]